jgi:hypothetical protein
VTASVSRPDGPNGNTNPVYCKRDCDDAQMRHGDRVPLTCRRRRGEIVVLVPLSRPLGRPAQPATAMTNRRREKSDTGSPGPCCWPRRPGPLAIGQPSQPAVARPPALAESNPNQRRGSPGACTSGRICRVSARAGGPPTPSQRSGGQQTLLPPWPRRTPSSSSNVHQAATMVRFSGGLARLDAAAVAANVGLRC